MSLAACIQRAVDGGEMDPRLAQRAQKEYDRLYADYRQHMSDQAAELKAGTDVQRIFIAEVLQKKRQTLLQIQAQRKIQQQMTLAGPSIGARVSAAKDALEKLDGSGVVISASQHQKALLGRAHAIMTEILATHKRDLLGRTREKMRLENLVRELFGVRTGDSAASEMAEAWSAAAEFLRKAFNEAGGAIPKLESWGLPQTHDVLKVREAGYEAWRDFIQPLLDRKRMIDWRTDKPLGDAELEIALRAAWETIRTDGWSKTKPSGAAGGTMVANRHGDHRFLHFADGDAWLKYSERFGSGDAFTAMMGHTAAMARDVGLMRALGPNPRATLRWMQESVQKSVSETGSRTDVDKANAGADALETLYDVYTGAANRPADGQWARAFMGTRNFITSSMLGSAALAAVSDLHFQRLAAHFSSLSHAGILDRYVALLDPRNGDERKLAVRLGLIAEEWTRIAASQARYLGEIEGPEWSQRLADFTLRVSGLSPWTQAGRWAFGMEFMGLLADRTSRSFDALEPELQKTMARYGLEAEAWEVIRQAPLYRHKGAAFLRPDDIANLAGHGPKRADELATRVMAMIQTETEYAVPTSSIRARAVLAGRVRPGTVPGELLRSTLMFKNFGITMISTHGRRAWTEGAAGRLDYAASLAIGSAIMGAISMTMKDISKGRDPRDMMEHPAAFWAAAIAQGGGFGIFGDFFFSDHNRFGGGIAETIAGPVVSFAGDAAKLTLGNAAQAIKGERMEFSRELVNFIGRYSGPPSSVWYGRLGYERTIINRLQQMADPKFDKRVRALERKLEREQGSGFWWRPGDGLPGGSPEQYRR